jgi:hypothetical protein
MSSQHIQSFLPGLAPRAPRLGTLRAVLTDRVARIGQSVWRFLEAYGRQRSAHELLALADRWQGENPKLARELRSYVRGGSTYRTRAG